MTSKQNVRNIVTLLGGALPFLMFPVGISDAVEFEIITINLLKKDPVL